MILWITMSIWQTCIWAILIVCKIQVSNGQSHDDIHGGVAMGIPSNFCDDAERYIEMDWNPNSTDEYTCTEGRIGKAEPGVHSSSCEEHAQRPLHSCYPHTITYTDDLPTSGTHRPLWPKYGEYKYVPPQRWIHSLEHGAIVFLYNPCADLEQIEEFKAVARGCLYKHIISPYKKLPKGMNFALLAWKCKLVMRGVDQSLMVQFIKTKALKAPEGTNADGQYKIGLLQPAKIVSDDVDSNLCPSMLMMSEMAKMISSKSAERTRQAQQAQANLDEIMDRFMADFSR